MMRPALFLCAPPRIIGRHWLRRSIHIFIQSKFCCTYSTACRRRTCASPPTINRHVRFRLRAKRTKPHWLINLRIKSKSIPICKILPSTCRRRGFYRTITLNSVWREDRDDCASIATNEPAGAGAGGSGGVGGFFPGQLVFVELAFPCHRRFASRSRETKTGAH